MKEQIEKKLQCLIGLPLTGSSRAANLEMFTFGSKHVASDRHGNQLLVDDYALHVDCAWRIVGPQGIVVASRDLYYPAGDPEQEPRDFEWDESGANRRDEYMKAFSQERGTAPLIVQAVHADSVGSVRLILSDDYTLDIFPNTSRPDEHWRLFQPRAAAKHFVVTGRGVES